MQEWKTESKIEKKEKVFVGHDAEITSVRLLMSLVLMNLRKKKASSVAKISEIRYRKQKTCIRAGLEDASLPPHGS